MDVTTDLRTQNLRQDLLKQPFRVRTSWNVITGAPCAGKTTILNALSQSGYQVRNEVARNYIESRQALGETLHDIRKDEAAFQRGLINYKTELEDSCQPEQLIFFDRAMPDSITYYRIAGLNPNDVLADCFNYQYARVFIFDPLPFETDNARSENQQTVDFLDSWLERDYIALGYNTIRVPLMPVNERLNFILDKI